MIDKNIKHYSIFKFINFIFVLKYEIFLKCVKTKFFFKKIYKIDNIKNFNKLNILWFLYLIKKKSFQCDLLNKTIIIKKYNIFKKVF